VSGARAQPGEAGGPGSRRVELPDGRILAVRPSRPADVDPLTALYGGLSVDDLHLRFFSVYHPPRSFFERLADPTPTGGCTLVAVVDDPVERIVGEADYTLLDSGDGELSLTVSPDWRGWLGPYLLDALLEAAAARGVPNLEAEVLVENNRMLALVRRRGYATVDHADHSVVRVTIGTATPMPTWSGPHDRPRVLVEAPGGRWHAEGAARAHGMAVLVCPGPHAGPGAHCPALDGQPCPLASDADVIVFGLREGDARADAVLAAHRRLHPGARVAVEHRGARDGPVACGALVLDPHIADDGLLAVLDRLAASAGPPATG